MSHSSRALPCRQAANVVLRQNIASLDKKKEFGGDCRKAPEVPCKRKIGI